MISGCADWTRPTRLAHNLWIWPSPKKSVDQFRKVVDQLSGFKMKPNRSSSNNWGHYLKWKTQVFIILVGLRESEGTSERFEGMFLHYVPLLSDVRSLRSLKLSPGAILFLHTLTGCKVLAPATLTSCIHLRGFRFAFGSSLSLSDSGAGFLTWESASRCIIFC